MQNLIAKITIFFSLLICSLNSFAYTKERITKFAEYLKNVRDNSTIKLKDSSHDGVIVFSNNYEDTIIMVVDLTKNKLSHRTLTKKGDDYYRYNISDFSKKDDIALVNGGFFDNKKDPTPLSFPYTPGNNSWRDSNNTRSLCVNGNVARVEHNGKTKVDLSYKCDFSLTLLSPDVNKNENDYLGRTYIGLPDLSFKGNVYNSNYLIFFLAKNKTQKQMVELAEKWGVHKYNLIMGDGSSSTQFHMSTINSFIGNNCRYGKFWNCNSRKIPHAIAVEKK